MLDMWTRKVYYEHMHIIILKNVSPRVKKQGIALVSSRERLSSLRG